MLGTESNKIQTIIMIRIGGYQILYISLNYYNYNLFSIKFLLQQSKVVHFKEDSLINITMSFLYLKLYNYYLHCNPPKWKYGLTEWI